MEIFLERVYCMPNQDADEILQYYGHLLLALYRNNTADENYNYLSNIFTKPDCIPVAQAQMLIFNETVERGFPVTVEQYTKLQEVLHQTINKMAGKSQ